MDTKQTGEKDERKSGGLFLLVFFLFSIATCVLGVLCLGEAKSLFLARNFILFSILLCALVAISCGVSVWFVLTKKDTFSKSMVSVYVLTVVVLALCYLFQKTGFFEVVKSAEALQAYIEKAGAWMPILYILLQFLQVVVLPIPSFVSTVVGVALFGALPAMIYSLIGIFIGSVLAFWIGRKLGYRAVSWMVGEDTLKKWQKKLKGKDNLFLTVMFIFPVFPDDVLCFIAGLSSMTTQYFLIMIAIARVLGVGATCFSIDFIPFDTWWGLLIWGVLALLVVTAFVIIYKNMDKIQEWFKNRQKRKK